MPKLFIIALFSGFILFSCHQREKIDKNKYRIVFENAFWEKVDLKTGILNINFYDLKYTDTLNLTLSQNQQILTSFEKSGLSDLNGNFLYEPRRDIMPAFYETIKIFKDGKPTLTLKINTHCQAGLLPLGNRYEAIHFRDVILNLLNQNNKFKQAQDRHWKYMEDHHILYL